MPEAAAVSALLGLLGTLIVGLFIAWFAHRLNVNEKAADSRDRDARKARQEITDELRAQSSAIAAIAEAQAITTSQIGPLMDRMTIVESGHNTLDTATQLLRQEIRLWREWTRQESSERGRAG